MSVSVSNLTKTYGDKKAIDGITFEVSPGEIVGFLGPNGAGKTTTMRVVTGYLRPSEGSVKVLGREVADHSLEVRREVGYLPENNPLYSDMNVLEYLEFSGLLNGVAKIDIHRKVREMIGVCGISDVKHLDIGQISKGFRQRVGLAQAMIHDPKVLILDEPTSGLDPNQIVEIRNLIRQLGREKTVILSTHILPEVQALCSRIIIVNRGKIVADGSSGELQARLQGGEQYYVEMEKPVNESWDALRTQVQSISSVAAVNLVSDAGGILRVKIESNRGADVRRDIYHLCVKKGWTLLELHREQTSLEDIFHELTAEAA
jgi:ABC-2 type transport system ATP-binding protein